MLIKRQPIEGKKTKGTGFSGRIERVQLDIQLERPIKMLKGTDRRQQRAHGVQRSPFVRNYGFA
jgi:hypothetical protein